MTAALNNLELKIVLLSFKEDNNFILYAPTLDLSGYGEDEVAAEASFKESLFEFLNFTMKNQTLDAELKRLGWKSDLKPPFLDDLLQKNSYLAEIVREKDFMKTEKTFITPLNQ